MIPYVPDQYTTLFKLGPIEIHLFGVLVAIGILVGANRVKVRAAQLGLDELSASSLSTWVVVCGFIVAHVFDVIAYQPDELAHRAWLPDFSQWRLAAPIASLTASKIGLVFNIASGISSFGGFLGALLALLYWTRRERKPILVCADSLLYGLTFGWFFGRLGCYTAHDHPGAATTFFLAVDYPRFGPRHDLGFDEALFAGLLAASFALLARRPHRTGFYAAIACSFYGPVRFGLDFLRVDGEPNADPRYFGLTPAQYGSIAVMIVGLVLGARIRKRRPDASSGGSSIITEKEGERTTTEASPHAGA